MFVFFLIFASGLVLIKPAGGSPLPSPQLIVKSQSNLFSNQPGRQVDLSDVLPTDELFWLNLEEGYFACQLNESEKFLKIFRISRLCDYKEDCYKGSDELQKDLRCSTDCDPPCLNGVCLSSRPESQCHCDDGWGGKLCEEPDLNECKYRPCSLFAQCTNTLGSFYCTCRPGYVGDGFECRPEVEKDDTEYDLINEVVDDDLVGNPGLRNSICTYNGVEYLEGEEVFTQRRCSECKCRNGEIRCEKVVCPDNPPRDGCRAVTRPDKCCPDYVCQDNAGLSGLNGGSLPRNVDLDESRFADVIQNVKDLIGGLDRSPIPTPATASPTPISILDFVVNGGNGAKKPDTGLINATGDNSGLEATTQTVLTSTQVKTTKQAPTRTVDDVDKTIEVIKTVQNIIGDLEEEKIYTNKTKDEISSDAKEPCEKDCVFKEDHAIVYTSTFSPPSTSMQEILISSEPRAPATAIPGIVQLSISPSPAENSSDFEPIVASEATIIEGTTEDMTSITVTNDEGIKIQDDDVLIEINFPGDYNENREDDVSVKFTFEDEKDNEIDDTAFNIYENENAYLYDVVTDSPTTTPFRPPNFDSLPIFEKDIFDPTIHNTFFEENMETDYSTTTRNENAVVTQTEISKMNNEVPVRENETSRPEMKTNLPETAVKAETDITVTENTMFDKEYTTIENNEAPTINYNNVGINPKDFPSVTESKDTEYTESTSTQRGETLSVDNSLTMNDMWNDKNTETTKNDGEDMSAIINNAADDRRATEKSSFSGPARPRYNLEEEEQGSGMEQQTSITDFEVTSPILAGEETTEPTQAANNYDVATTDSTGTMITVSTISGTEYESVSGYDDDKTSQTDNYNDKRPDTTPSSTIYAPELDENTPSLVKQLDEGLPSTAADYEPTGFTDKYTITQEEVTEQYVERVTTVHSPTEFDIGMEATVSLTNSEKSETGSENGSTTISPKMPTSESSEPERVTVDKIESRNSTFSPPTPSKSGDKTELKENTAAASDESSFSTISPQQTTTFQSSVTSFKTTSINTFEDIQPVKQNEMDSTLATESEDEEETNDVDEALNDIKMGEDNTINKLDVAADINKSNINSLNTTPKNNFGTQSADKIGEKMTTKRPNTSQVSTNGAQPRRDDSVFEECLALNLPNQFHSFSGQAATNIADCSWDFFGCTKKYGKWPENKACCEDRFSECSMLVMGMGNTTDVDTITTRRKGGSNSRKNIGNSDKIAVNQIPSGNINKDLLSKESRLNDEETKIFLIHCVWKYMNCSTDDDRIEHECRDQFSSCSDNVDDKDEEGVKGLPDIPGVDLPSLIQSGNEYASCILVFYNCSDTKLACKKKFNDCTNKLPVKVSAGKTPDSQGSSSTKDTEDRYKPNASIESGKQPKSKDRKGSSSTKESGDRYTPNISEGSGKIPEIQCTWSFFQCKKSAQICKKEHDDCLNGNLFDNKICAGVAKHPQRYLVPHPTDCTKFYSCQRQGWGGWIANPMDCPVTTGFDKSLMICNYINSLPRCKEDVARSLHSDNLGPGLIAKQTQQQLEVQVGNLGYLSAQNLTSHGRKLIPNMSFYMALCMFVSLRLLT